MHEATQRRLLRAAFLVLCLLPTLAVLGWAIAWSLPRHAARPGEPAARSTGRVVRLDRVTHPAPGLPAAGRRATARPRNTSNGWLKLPQCTSLGPVNSCDPSGAQATVPLQQCQRLWQLLHDGVLSQDLPQGPAATLACDQLMVHSAGESYLLHELTGSMRRDADSVGAELRCDCRSIRQDPRCN